MYSSLKDKQLIQPRNLFQLEEALGAALEEALEEAQEEALEEVQEGQIQQQIQQIQHREELLVQVVPQFQMIRRETQKIVRMSI